MQKIRRQSRAEQVPKTGSSSYLRIVRRSQQGQRNGPANGHVTTAMRENKRAAAYIERTSAQICETMSLALTSGMGKGSNRDKARAMDGGVGSLISIKVTNGLPLQRDTLSAKWLRLQLAWGCMPEHGCYGTFRVTAAVFAKNCN